MMTKSQYGMPFIGIHYDFADDRAGLNGFEIDCWRSTSLSADDQTARPQNRTTEKPVTKGWYLI